MPDAQLIDHIHRNHKPMNSTDITLTTEEIAENWIADRSLPTEIVELLEEAQATNLETAGLASPSIAPSYICTELDLPQGSTWPEVVASLLDAVSPDANGIIRDHHLNAIRDALGIEEEE